MQEEGKGVRKGKSDRFFPMNSCDDIRVQDGESEHTLTDDETGTEIAKERAWRTIFWRNHITFKVANTK